MGARLELLCDRLPDERSGMVLVLSHCLLNQTSATWAGGVHPGMVEEAEGLFVHQLRRALHRKGIEVCFRNTS